MSLWLPAHSSSRWSFSSSRVGPKPRPKRMGFGWLVNWSQKQKALKIISKTLYYTVVKELESSARITAARTLYFMAAGAWYGERFLLETNLTRNKSVSGPNAVVSILPCETLSPWAPLRTKAGATHLSSKSRFARRLCLGWLNFHGTCGSLLWGTNPSGKLGVSVILEFRKACSWKYGSQTLSAQEKSWF